MAAGENYPAGKLTVKGTTFEIFTNDDGAWLAYISGNKVTGTSREDLGKQIGRTIAKAKITVAVRFMVAAGDGYGEHTGRGDPRVRRGTAYGVHSSSRNVLVEWDDGEKGQLTSYGRGALHDTDELAETYARLRKEYLDASKAIYAFQEAHKMELNKEVREAMDAALDAAGS
jgi:hypothetical protein